ncbi:unnamed protein product [Urochloa decumbens]|uniref:Phytocyanin domain-containing protein n=1 Tax=Urochloa decumbens TaxID=240449 RepID=A0ABC9ERD9_9POAL
MGVGAARRAAVAALLAVAVLAGVASAAVYEVGGKIGWTVMGNPDYAGWAGNKTFHKNDVVDGGMPMSCKVSLVAMLFLPLEMPITQSQSGYRCFHVFTYNKQYHNVMAVSKADYKNCVANKPIATWSTGNDSVVLNTTGHHYFICGFTGHCAAGQKVDIRVASSAASSPAPAPAPSGGGSNPSGGATAAPSPHPNAAPKALLAVSSVAATVAASLLSLAAAVLA